MQCLLNGTATVPSLPGGESGRGSPMSPSAVAAVAGRIGSPIKTQGGKKMAATAVIDPSTSKVQFSQKLPCKA